MIWEKQIVCIWEGSERRWRVLLTAPGRWVSCGRFASRAGAEAYGPEAPPAWINYELGEPREAAPKAVARAASAGPGR